MAAADLAIRAGVSVSTLGRLEKGDAGVAVGALADVLVALSLIERLADLVDVRTDALGLALSEQQLPKRGRSVSVSLYRRKRQGAKAPAAPQDVIDPDGAAF